MPDRKINFAVNLPLRLFRATVANAYTVSLDSLRTLFATYLNHMLAKLEVNRRVRNVRNFEFFDKTKNEFFKTTFGKSLTLFFKKFL